MAAAGREINFKEDSAVKKMIAAFGLFTMLTGCAGKAPDLGITTGQLTPCPASPNCVCSQATDKTHQIEPLRMEIAFQDARARLVKILSSEKRVKILINRETYIRAEFSSSVFRFVDDVEFYFPQTGGDKTIIHVRSASRIGYSDLGVNRKRIERIRTRFQNAR